MIHARTALISILTTILFHSVVYTVPGSRAQETDEGKVIYLETGAPCISAECHPRMGGKKYVHKIGIDPNACERCHAIIQPGVHRFAKITERTADLCVQCHDINTEKPPDVMLNPPKILFTGDNMNWHKPFSDGKCTICHDAHESDYSKHLKAEYPATPYATYSSGAYRLCFISQCHQDLHNALELPRTLSGTKFRNGNVNLHYKHVNKQKGRTCRTCHRLHGSPFPSLITGSFAFGTRVLKLEYEQTETGGSCKTPCHSTGGYDRYAPVINSIHSTPTPGKDATQDELEKSRAGELIEQRPENQ